MCLAVAQSHDGVAVVVPVDDESAAAQDAHKPSHCNAGQARGILGYKHSHYQGQSYSHLIKVFRYKLLIGYMHSN